MDPQEELQQLRDREEALKKELKAKKKALQEAQRRQRDTLTRQIRRRPQAPHPPLDPDRLLHRQRQPSRTGFQEASHEGTR